eukprot:2883703-Pyramimonas_sp.AAC.1
MGFVKPRSVSGSASGTRPRVPARVQGRVEACLAALQKRFRRAPQSSSVHQFIREPFRCECLFALRVLGATK